MRTGFSGRGLPKSGVGRRNELEAAARLGDLLNAQEYVAAELDQLKRMKEYTLGDEPRIAGAKLGPEAKKLKGLVRGPRGKWLMKPAEAEEAWAEFEEEGQEEADIESRAIEVEGLLREADPWGELESPESGD